MEKNVFVGYLKCWFLSPDGQTYTWQTKPTYEYQWISVIFPVVPVIMLQETFPKLFVTAFVFLKLGSVIQFLGGVTHQFWPAHPLVSHNNGFTSMERSVQMDLAVFNQADGHLLNPDSQYVERKYLMWQQVLLSALVFRLTFTGGRAKTHTIATLLDWISKNTRTCMLLCSVGK